MPKKKPPSLDNVLLPTQRMVEADAADKRLDDDIKQTMTATLQALKKGSAQPYDGILGRLYESWPPYHHTQFEKAREWILKRVSHAKALRFLHEYGKIFALDYNRLATIPVAYIGAIGTLHGYFTAWKLGEVEGLRMVADDNAVIGLRARTGHKNRKAARDKPKIQRIGKKYWKAHLKATVKEIQNCEEFKAYMKDKKPYADRTIANWLREVDPRPLSAKRGPRSLRH